MREIKFRAKPNKAYFFESDNVPTTDGFVFGTPDTRMLNVPGAEKWRKEHEMVDQPSIVAMTRDGWPCSVAVQEETIGQFTGMHDKCGDEIYEGDIVKFDGEQENGVVVYDERQALFGLKYDDPYNPRIFGLYDCKPKELEIVGNRYDNSELLKE